MGEEIASWRQPDDLLHLIIAEPFSHKVLFTYIKVDKVFLK